MLIGKQLLFMFCTIAFVGAQKPDLVIFDTVNHEQAIHKPFVQMLGKEWNVSYTPLDQLMDADINSLEPKEKAAFFIFGIEFLKGLSISSPVSQKIVQLIKKYSLAQNKLIGLSFPSITISPEANLVTKFAPIFDASISWSGSIMSQTPTSTQLVFVPSNELAAFTSVANYFLARPLESRPLKYHTTLVPPHMGINFYTPEIKELLEKNAGIVKMLPQKNIGSDVVCDTVPYGLYFIDKNNHILITQASMLSFSGITENCHFCPMNFKLRREILSGVGDTIAQATDIFLRNQQANVLTDTSSKASNSDDIAVGQKLDTSEPSLRKTAWMELTVFMPQSQEMINKVVQAAGSDKVLTSTQAVDLIAERQKNLIDYIFDSNLDALWISVCPNCYYSPIALQKHNEKNMLESIANFTKQLKESGEKRQASLPKILIGFEIANNLYNDGVPKIFAQDVYGNGYQDIPDPLNSDFWKNEVETPFAKFVQEWNKPEVGNGLKISGIMLDLEMYCRKSSGIFLATMGITQNNLSDFFTEQQLKPGPMTFSGSISYLMSQKLSQKYFDFLQDRAKQLGERLKKSFDEQVPECVLALYMPNLLSSWFYKGLYKGLNRTTQPLYLFSFNAEFNYHKDWFVKNKLNVHHSSAILLSKYVGPESFVLTEEALEKNNGVWFNRYSRLIEPKSNDWTSVEKPMFPENMRQKYTRDLVVYIGKI